MTGLVDPRGRPISSSQFKKKPALNVGDRFGSWAGDNQRPLTALPGGGAIQFNLDNLTLADFRQMKDNYQINSSLSLLTFLLHQMEWHIECDNKKNGQRIEDNLREMWTRIVRAMSQAFWAGYAPSIIEFDNNVQNRSIDLSAIKDLFPEDCMVHWKTIDGYKPPTASVAPKIRVFDGISQFGWPYHIPVENSFWYPLLMENGNYYGRKLLRPAFQSWFFSILMHLFANRYYERYGEPTPVGRAPYDDVIEVDDQTSLRGNELMANLIQQLRNRSVVVLPNERTPIGSETNPQYDYTLEYLESQMRGADFERYMSRLDEEMSLALFTPILLMRTADVGSYNLGVGHMKVYLWMMNAVSGDWKYYLDRYIIRPLNEYNFGVRAPKASIKFAPMNNDNQAMLENLLVAMVTGGMAKPDLQTLGEIVGLKLTEIEQVTAPTTPLDPAVPPKKKSDTKANRGIYSVVENICNRIERQVANAKKEGRFENLEASFGYAKQFEQALEDFGFSDSQQAASYFFMILQEFMANTVALGWRYNSVPDFMRQFRSAIFSEVDLLLEKK